VTLMLSFVGIAVSLPLGILLALGRRSTMPVVKMICVVFIEMIRGVPLITVLFMASVMLPLFLPAGRDLRQVPARADRRFAVRVGLYGRGGARRSPGHPEGTV
jgi:His/Glu/Gln/Arg/opine family amino acid ABC transporter permease subunit